MATGRISLFIVGLGWSGGEIPSVQYLEIAAPRAVSNVSTRVLQFSHRYCEDQTIFFLLKVPFDMRLTLGKGTNSK